MGVIINIFCKTFCWGRGLRAQMLAHAAAEHQLMSLPNDKGGWIKKQ
jgi:hypothetical protein